MQSKRGVARIDLAGRPYRRAPHWINQGVNLMESSEPTASFARDQLKAFVERIERLEEEKKAIGDDIKDVYTEAKGNGFDVKVLRQIIRLRKQEPNERQEQEALMDLYLSALGMLGDSIDT